MTIRQQDRRRVAVVGGGWSGLAAAVELALHGHVPFVFEAARQTGGRARAVRVDGHTLDNGQHLLVGACHELLRLLDTVHEGPPPLERQPMRLHSFEGDRQVRLAAPRLPSPFHLLAALMSARGLRWNERFAAMRLGLSLRAAAPDHDSTVLEWLRAGGQPECLIRSLWGPLCLAALNTAPEAASARTFRRVLRETLASRRADSDFLFPQTDLGRLFPLPASEFIENRGGRVRLGARVTAVRAANGRATGVTLESGETTAADAVILAVPPPAAVRLLQPHQAAASLVESLRGLRHQPITTVYLHYPGDSPMAETMYGVHGMTAQWLLNRTPRGRPGTIAAVISGDGPHMGIPRRELGRRVADELGALFPRWPAPESTTVLRERRATFTCEAGVDERRPGYRTALPGLWMAGDHIATGYPATLEGAVRSGVECARLIAGVVPADS